jgi:hypothetical protein
MNSAQFLVSPRVSLIFLIKKYIKIKILKMCSVDDIPTKIPNVMLQGF